jgi:16S rRNA (cytidine1402-2'-O)-methyltransferase
MAAKHTLYIVATPIGHRDDLSHRAIATLQGVNRIYAEDTRHSKSLLQHHGIHTPVSSLHEHNESALTLDIVQRLQSGDSAALISDAGTPLISDPGYRLVRACLKAAIPVSPIPGPCALIAALSVSGIATDHFEFVGFAPAKQAARVQWLKDLQPGTHTLVMYETPHRIAACLRDCADVFGTDREMTLLRELTKRFETVLHGEVGSLAQKVLDDANQQRGEFVLVFSGNTESTSHAQLSLDRVLACLESLLPPKQVARCAAELTGVSRQVAYSRLLERKQR